MTVGSKGLTIIAIFMGLISILCLGLALTATSKYRTQRHRVLELEEKIAAGKGELLKVPQLQLKMQDEQKQRRTVEEELAGLKEEKDALAAEYEGFKKEQELLTVAKTLTERELQQREVALIEARRNVADLDGKVKTLEELRVNTERRLAELDQDVRAGATKIEDLSSEIEALRKENELLKAEKPAALERVKALEEELERYQTAPGGAAPAAPPEGPEAPGELQKLRAKVAELTNELLSITKAKLTAEKTVEELQKQLAER